MTTFRIKAVDKNQAEHAKAKRPRGWIIALLGLAVLGICAAIIWTAHENGIDLWRYMIVLAKGLG